MIHPLHFENDRYIIHTFLPSDLLRFDAIAEEIYTILSDDYTLRYIPAKRMTNRKQAVEFLQNMILNFHTGRNYLHFITDKRLGKIVGLVDLISPEMAMEHYQISRYPFFIEFYLGSFSSGCYLMTEILPVLVNQLLGQGIINLAAVVNRNNIAAKKVLKKASFIKKHPFDDFQDLYE